MRMQLTFAHFTNPFLAVERYDAGQQKISSSTNNRHIVSEEYDEHWYPIKDGAVCVYSTL